MYIPRLADRVSCMIFRRRFKHELEEILPDLDTIQMAMTELRESTRFKQVLKVKKIIVFDVCAVLMCILVDCIGYW